MTTLIYVTTGGCALDQNMFILKRKRSMFLISSRKMALTSGQKKEYEKLFNQKLYENVQLLSYCNPPPKEFITVLHTDMFFKNNTTAFHYLIHYLFNIIDPDLTKEKLVSWPLVLCESKLEKDFRKEVSKIVNELNARYTHIEIPHLMESHLVCPGGIKFSEYMFKISSLAMYVHLERKKPGTILKVKYSNKSLGVNELNKKLLEKRTAVVEAATKNMLKTFNETHQELSDEATNIVALQTQVDKDIAAVEALKKYKDLSFDLVKVEEKLQDLQKKMEALDNIKNMCLKIGELNEYLLSENGTLEYKETFVIPDNIKHLIKSQDTLDLVELFNDLAGFLENEQLKMPEFNANEINELTKMIKQTSEKYVSLDGLFLERREELLELLKNVSHT